jgi:hypothetical protein
MKSLCTQVVSKLASTLLLYLDRNNSNEHNKIGLLSLLQNTSLSVFCSNDPYPSKYAEDPSER